MAATAIQSARMDSGVLCDCNYQAERHFESSNEVGYSVKAEMPEGQVLANSKSFDNVVDMAFNSLHQQGGVDSSSSSLDDEAGKSAENLEAEIDRDSDNPPAVKFETVANYERKSGFGDIWTCLAVYGLICAFCILGPILALGWMLLPFTHGMWHFAAFVTAYCVTQNLPPFYLRAYKQGPIGGIFIRELVYYMTPFKVVKEATLDPAQKYIFAWHPHGRLFYGFGTFLGLFFEWFPEIADAGKDIFAGINDVMFRIPFLSNWLYLCGNIPCNKSSVVSKLQRGDSVALIIGGIDEVLEGTFDDQDVLYLLNRKGFCKLAIEQGAGLVPVFCFGENSIFAHETRGGLFGLDFWRAVNRFVKLGAPFPIRGVWGLPFPRRVPMLVATGAPLFPLAGESVDAFHARYVAALVALHARHAPRSPYPNRRLVLG